MKLADLHSQLESLHPNSFAWAVACCRGDRDEAADVLQTAYEKVLNGKARFGGGSALKTWLFGVIRLTAQEFFRRTVRRNEALEKLTLEPRSWSEEVIDAEQVGLALNQLSPQQRELTHLVFYEGMTIQEAADALEVSVGTARQHYARAKQKLREQLQPIATAS
ncbi:MAG: RNA polymerase sigma factor (sigma-70 family) [Verrucomicrobiales bacterium]